MGAPYEMFRQQILESYYIDIDVVFKSWWLKAIIICYVVAAIYFLVQKFRDKVITDDDISLLSLAKNTWFFYQGSMAFVLIYIWINQFGWVNDLWWGIPVAVVLGFIFWIPPICMIVDLVRNNGFFNGIVYTFALLGFGIIGIAAILLYAVIAMIPMVIFIMALIIDENR